MFIDQFLAQLPEAIWIFGRKALVKMNVLSFNVPKIVERFHQNAQINLFRVRQQAVFCLKIAVRVPRAAMRLRLRR